MSRRAEIHPGPIFLLILGLLAMPLAAVPATLPEWLDHAGASATIDPLRRVLVIRRGGDSLVIPVGATWGILNDSRKLPLPGLAWEGGSLVFTSTVRDSLDDLFFPESPQAGPQSRIATIFIDPGHGGRDPGALGTQTIGGKKETLQEKDIVLKTGLLLRDLLARNLPGVKVVMSRSTDVFLTLDERTRIANGYARGRDSSVLFVSLHVNASLNSRARGFEVWYLPPETRRQVVKPGDYDVDSTVLPIINSLKEEEISVGSYLLAAQILSGIQSKVQGRAPSRGLKQEEWYVVRNSFMPSVLVELGFLSNPEEYLLLRSPAYLQNLAEGIYSGIVQFIESYQAVTP